MRRSPLKRTTSIGPGKLSLTRQSTFKPRAGSPASKRRAISPASKEQRAKVAASEYCDPAHLTPRGFRGCDSPDCVIALCREHHRALDEHRLDLLPHLSGRGFERELAHMQAHYSDPLSVLVRLSSTHWIPDTSRSAA
jgi:hypothetical protein